MRIGKLKIVATAFALVMAVLAPQVRADLAENGNVTVTGTVGVGTAAPVAKLEVNGTAKIDGVVTASPGRDVPMFAGY